MSIYDCVFVYDLIDTTTTSITSLPVVLTNTNNLISYSLIPSSSDKGDHLLRVRATVDFLLYNRNFVFTLSIKDKCLKPTATSPASINNQICYDN